MPCTVLVCKNTTCSQQGSAKVLAAFEARSPAGVTVNRSGCLGECGNGPMVVVLPEESTQKVWYAHVQPHDVPIIVSQHLEGGKIVTQKLHAKFHPKDPSLKGWLIVFGILLMLVLAWVGILVTQSSYV